jgi:hypothetical protein
VFEQFRENLSLTKEFAKDARKGLIHWKATWQKATPMKKAIWLAVPTVILVHAVADHFSVPWYYQAA